jgi:hypothetical protein
MKDSERGGNGGQWKTEENQDQVSLSFPPVLGNRCAISTFSTAPTILALSLQENNPKSKKGARASRSPHFHSFRLILQLENAQLFTISSL